MRLRQTTTLVLFLALSAGTAAAAPEDKKADAKALYEEGLKAEKAGDAKTALIAFKAAYDKLPSVKILFNIGQACKATGDVVCAVKAYEQFLERGEPTKKEQTKAETDLKTLVKAIGRLAIKSPIPAADITVDDAVVGRTPSADNVPVVPGSHRIVITYHGKPVEKTVKVAAGETARVEVEMPEETAPPVVVRPPKKEEPSAPPPPVATEPRPFPVLPWAIAGALAGGAVITGILSASAVSDYNDTKERYPITRDELESSQASARDLFLVTGILGVGALVSASIGAYFTFLSPTVPATNPKVGLAAGPGGVSIVGVIP